MKIDMPPPWRYELVSTTGFRQPKVDVDYQLIADNGTCPGIIWGGYDNAKDIAAQAAHAPAMQAKIDRLRGLLAEHHWCFGSRSQNHSSNCKCLGCRTRKELNEALQWKRE